MSVVCMIADNMITLENDQNYPLKQIYQVFGPRSVANFWSCILDEDGSLLTKKEK